MPARRWSHTDRASLGTARSAGAARAGPRGAYAILHTSGHGGSAWTRRVVYDAPAVAREMRSAGLPDELADKLVIPA